MINGVTINGKHSYTDYGLFFAKRPDYGVPEPETNYVEVPGSDGDLDLTEYTGFVRYKNREMTVEFSAKVKIDEQEQFESILWNELHGQHVELIFDEQPEWVYRGRASISFHDILPWKLRMTMTVNAEPYKLALEEASVEIELPTEETDLHTFEVAPTVIDEHGSRTEYRYDDQDGDFSYFESIFVYYKNRTASDFSVGVTDANGVGIGFQEITPDFPSSGYIEIVFDDNIDSEKIRVVSCTGANIENVQGALHATGHDIYNDYMRVVPQILLSGSHPAVLFTGGKLEKIYPGSRLYENLVLLPGKNTIGVHRLNNSGAQTMTLKFRKGRL